MLYALWPFSFCSCSTILCFRHFTFYLSTPSHVIVYFHINTLHIFILLFIKIIVLITSNLNVTSPFASCFSHGAIFKNLLSFVCCMHSGLFLFALVVQFFVFTICCHISVHASLKKLIICCKQSSMARNMPNLETNSIPKYTCSRIFAMSPMSSLPPSFQEMTQSMQIDHIFSFNTFQFICMHIK